jgi:hypothetical protein
MIIGWTHSCRSWLASDDGLEFNTFNAPFAGKPAPTRFCVEHKKPDGFGAARFV